MNLEISFEPRKKAVSKTRRLRKNKAVRGVVKRDYVVACPI
jgi:hypothetical protein